MTWVKICGMTNLEDALVAVDAGADAVGFVFYEKSPRCVTVETAREICAKLPESVEKVGVFVGSDGDPLRVIWNAGLTGTQTYLFSGKSPAKATGAAAFPPRFRSLLALPVNLIGQDRDGFERAASAFVNLGKNIPVPVSRLPNAFVLDSGNLQQPGGTGESFDWKKAASVAEGMRKSGLNVVVAGGLTPLNVSEAIDVLHPWGVDVASGVEARPGKKDPEKVRAFVKAVREADRKAS